MNEKQEPYRYQDDASVEMLVRLLVTDDGRGKKDKALALRKLIEGGSVDKDRIEVAIQKRLNGEI